MLFRIVNYCSQNGTCCLPYNVEQGKKVKGFEKRNMKGCVILFQSQQARYDYSDIGTRFPYKRGETPIFHFDEGDEKFIETIPGGNSCDFYLYFYGLRYWN